MNVRIKDIVHTQRYGFTMLCGAWYGSAQVRLGTAGAVDSVGDKIFHVFVEGVETTDNVTCVLCAAEAP